MLVYAVMVMFVLLWGGGGLGGGTINTKGLSLEDGTVHTHIKPPPLVHIRR